MPYNLEKIVGIKDPKRFVQKFYDWLMSVPEKTFPRKKDVLICLWEYLKNNTNWETSPASSKYHLNEESGLIRHTVNVLNTLFKLRDTLAPEITDESCIIVALLHDLGKTGLYCKRMPETIGKQSWMVKKDVVKTAVPIRSLVIASRFIILTDEEVQAIAYHDGLYVPSGREVQHTESRLMLLLHWADYWASHVLEEKN